MPTANINDRKTVETIYPAAAWEQDAARNSRGYAAVTYGVTILSAPDAGGAFEMSPTSHHVGENDPEGDTVFVPAFEADAAAAQDSGTYGGSLADVADTPNDGSDYARFVDRVLEIARTAQFKPPIGKGEERLKGFRGG